MRSRSVSRLGALALFALGISRVVVACASEDDAPSAPVNPDAAPDVTVMLDASPPPDATATGDADVPYDAGPPLVVKCAQEPCATTLTSTRAFCALLDNGKVACWGSNASYSLGRGLDAGAADDINPAYVFGLENVESVSPGCAILDGGVAKCWGPGNLLQMVDGGPPPANTNISPAPVTLPLPPVRSVSIATDIGTNAGGCAVLVSGGITCWGYVIFNNFGFVDAGGTAYQDYTKTGTTTVTMPAAAGSPVQVAVGYSTFVRDDKDVTFSFGDQDSLGRASSIVNDPYPSPIAVSDVSAIDVSSTDICVVARGRVYCWGQPPASTLAHALPEEVLLPDPAVSVTTSPIGYPTTAPFTCAVTAKKELWCWGSNAYGQLGDGTKGTLVLTPVHVALPGPVVSARASYNDTCALLETGQVYCWGTTFRTLTPKAIVLP